MVQQNESFDSKLFQEKHFKLLSGRLTIESIDAFVAGSPVFTLTKFKFIGKLDCRRVIYQYPNTINTFQWQICCLNSKTFSKILYLLIRNIKRKRKIRHPIHFLAQQKQPLNKKNSLTRYYSTYLHFPEGFLIIAKTTKGVRFHQYIIK